KTGADILVTEKLSDLEGRLQPIDLTNRFAVANHLRILMDVGHLTLQPTEWEIARSKELADQGKETSPGELARDRVLAQLEKELETLGWSRKEVIKMRDQAISWSRFGRVGIPFRRRKTDGRRRGYRY